MSPIRTASNATFLGQLRTDGLDLACVYKPTQGERPLWDFPTDTLGRREVAAYEVSRAAGFDWRSAGCSMCLGMNPDILSPGERCASTSNRNFEGRQGFQGRTHLVSPAMAAAAALHGRLVDVRAEF